MQGFVFTVGQTNTYIVDRYTLQDGRLRWEKERYIAASLFALV